MMYFSRFFCSVLSILFYASSLNCNAQQFSGKVVAVKDGDTIEVLWEGKAQMVRLEHVDAPEKRQDFGSVAKQFVSDFCFGKTVRVVGNGKRDRNGRMIAEVFYNNQNLGKELVRNGLAWHYKKYSKSSVYAELEIRARARKNGLWKNDEAVAPWLWRGKKKPSKFVRPAA